MKWCWLLIVTMFLVGCGQSAPAPSGSAAPPDASQRSDKEPGSRVSVPEPL